MTEEENIGSNYRSSKIHEKRNYSIEWMKQNDLMNKK